MSQNNVLRGDLPKNNSLFVLLTKTAIFGMALLPLELSAAETESLQLPTVSVIDSREEKSYNSTENSFYKLNSSSLDTTRTVTTISQQLMKDQNITKVADALRNVPGISLAAGEGGIQGDNLNLRGFSARNDFFIDGMRDYGQYFRDPFNLENIEVVQGPSSILFGRGSTGGVIEQNSKQAFLGSKKDASLTFGTNETARITADVNAKIDGIEGAAFRLNAVAHENKVAKRDVAENKRFGIAPSLAFGLGTDTRLNLNYFHQREDNIPDYGIPWIGNEPANVDRSNFYGFKNSDHLITEANIGTAKFEHDFDNDLTLRNQTRYARYYRDNQVTRPDAVSGTTVTRTPRAIISNENYFGNHTDLMSKFSTFGIKHGLTTGFAVESESSNPTNFSFSTSSSSNGGKTDLNNPNYDDIYSGTKTISSIREVKLDTLALYAADKIDLSKKLQLNLGVRFDNIQTNYSSLDPNTSINTKLSRTDNLVSYSAGFNYKPAENGSIYFNHGTSFNPSAESFSLTVGTSNVKPESSKIYEIGTKWEFFKKRLSTAFAIFRNDKQNVRETASDGVSTILSGEQRVDGFQAQVSGNVTEKFKLIASYSLLDSRVIKSAQYPQYKNRELQNTPKHNFNLFGTYKFTPKFEAGGGANFLSERSGSTTSADVRYAPSYISFNAMAKYQINKNVGLQLNINNLFDTKFYDQVNNSYIVPSEGRVFLLTTSFSF